MASSIKFQNSSKGSQKRRKKGRKKPKSVVDLKGISAIDHATQRGAKECQLLIAKAVERRGNVHEGKIDAVSQAFDEYDSDDEYQYQNELWLQEGGTGESSYPAVDGLFVRGFKGIKYAGAKAIRNHVVVECINRTFSAVMSNFEAADIAVTNAKEAAIRAQILGELYNIWFFL